MHKVLVCLPVYHAVAPEPLLHFLMLAEQAGKDCASGGYSVRWMVGGPKVRTAVVRNTAAAQALECGATHLLFVDDDMAPPRDLIPRLLAHGVDVVSPLFFRASPPHEPMVFRPPGDGEGWRPVLDYARGTLMHVPGGIGTGVMLVRTEVFAALDPPWFYYPPDPAATMDLEFCRRAREAGFLLWCDTSIVVRQQGPAPMVGEEDFLGRSKLGQVLDADRIASKP